MAVVYRAYDRMLERTVAIKVLRKNFSGEPAFRERFRQEAKAAASLAHPNIVTVYDFGFDSKQIFIIMEYVPGTDLKTTLQKNGKLDLDQALLLMIQACAGIGFAHRSGLVHCDIKPQNMLITPDNRLKVVDFGIARALESIRPDEKHEIVWGSPQYFSPEQASGSPPSPASDVYSLGVILFESLTGQLPFTASSAEELGRMHRESLPPSPRRLAPTIPISLEQVILKTLSKEAAKRYRSADELESILMDQNMLISTNAFDLVSQEAWSNSSGMTGLSGSEASRYPLGIDQEYYENEPVKATPQTPQGQPQFDWITWLLALFALLIVGGLIPFWLWIYFLINPPFKAARFK